ncbi:DnaD domain protein [Streptococcus parasanguinis]|uniref:DnaD domain protein n=1 Tax=Streptococcus parasanguinis TaxID=1318 RepID=A0A7X2X364_STRPA|nr:conserved phage C-terminal domain-containing protein [Streptococcus parasanguinis]MTS01354.1 DnaD domain protein [Streptococcus parasanguinis]MTS53876.1 DnaD domain protein [Streptococcus parasanguinis]RYS58301.1 DnaD domain protein [Streptococcus parasanguinis]
MVTENRRYYWLQLKDDFFNSKEMKLMRKLPGGEEITIIYLKMMLVSLSEQGKLYFEGLAEDLAEELSLIIDEDPEAIRLTLMFLTKKKLLTTSDNYQFNLEQVPEMIGSETASARRVRKHRENQKALQCNSDVTKCNGDIDIDIDIDKGQKPQSDVYEEIIKYLNEKTGSHFKPTSKSTQRLINGRLSENYTIEDFKYVIDVKTNEWKDNTKMSKYLTPDTLFNASKFEKYRNQQIPKQQNVQKQDERLGF